MTIAYPGGISVVLRHRVPGPKDRQNNPTWTWDSTTLVGCLFAPRGSIELVGKTGDSVVTTDTLYPPWETVVSAEDEIVIYDLVYQVDGDPSRWENPWTDTKVLRLDLKRVTG